MKTIIITALILFSSFVAVHASDDEVGCSYHSEFNGQKYESVMPIRTLMESPDLELTKSELPTPLSKIIEVAYSQLVKITGTKEGWKVATITMNNWREKSEKWFYAVSFQTTNHMSFSHISILVTIDGQLGIVKQVTEKIIN